MNIKITAFVLLYMMLIMVGTIVFGIVSDWLTKRKLDRKREFYKSIHIKRDPSVLMQDWGKK